jgi:VWFA-related protein
MHLKKTKHLWPALMIALALFFLSTSLIISSSSAQKIKQLPPPPPVPRYKPKPTPTPAPIEYDVVRVTSNLVVVPVSVTNTQGQPVRDLTPTDFRIEEDGRPQEIAQLGDPEQVPLDIALLIDVSSSVTERFGFEEQAATRFLRQVLRPTDRATIYSVDQIPRLEQTRATAEIASAKLLTIEAAIRPTPTAFYDTVMAAARYLAANTPEQHRRVIVAISDGEDNYSNSVRDSAVAAYRASQSEDASSSIGRQRILTASEIALLEGHRKAQAEMQREVQKANAVFYSLNPSGQAIRLNAISERAQKAMEELAGSTGGSAFIPEVSSLEAVFNRIASELRGQYLLQYYSSNQAGTAFRKIVVSSPTHRELRVRAREGYYPKAK